MVYVDLSDPDTVGLVQQCADEIQRMGRGDETRCLAVEWSYDVAPDFPNTYDGGGGLSFVGLITPTGRYVESNYGASAPPGRRRGGKRPASASSGRAGRRASAPPAGQAPGAGRKAKGSAVWKAAAASPA